MNFRSIPFFFVLIGTRVNHVGNFFNCTDFCVLFILNSPSSHCRTVKPLLLHISQTCLRSIKNKQNVFIFFEILLIKFCFKFIVCSRRSSSCRISNIVFGKIPNLLVAYLSGSSHLLRPLTNAISYPCFHSIK